MEGDIVCGILAATYGQYQTATFSTWRKESLNTWRKEGNGPGAFTSEIDLDPWSWTVAPTLGGAAFDVSKNSDKGPRITGIRVVPPSFDVHSYNQMRSENTTGKTEGDSRKNIAVDYYRATHKNERKPHPEAEKKEARELRRLRQAEIERVTAEKYKKVFDERKNDDEKHDQETSAGSELRPSRTPVNFGLISVIRNTIPMFEGKGGGKGAAVPSRPLSPVKEAKIPKEDKPTKVKAPPENIKPTKEEKPPKDEMKNDPKKPSK